jgi:hypothetical protein
MDLDILAILESFPPDDLGKADISEPTYEEIEELLSSEKWRSDSTFIGCSDDVSVNDHTGTSAYGKQEMLPTSSHAPSIAHASGSEPGVAPSAQATQAPRRRLCATKMKFLSIMYDLSKGKEDGIVSLHEIRTASEDLATTLESCKNNLIYVLARTDGLLRYMSDIESAMKAKYKLTPEGLTLCQREFD